MVAWPRVGGVLAWVLPQGFANTAHPRAPCSTLTATAAARWFPSPIELDGLADETLLWGWHTSAASSHPIWLVGCLPGRIPVNAFLENSHILPIQNLGGDAFGGCWVPGPHLPAPWLWATHRFLNIMGCASKRSINHHSTSFLIALALPKFPSSFLDPCSQEQLWNEHLAKCPAFDGAGAGKDLTSLGSSWHL